MESPKSDSSLGTGVYYAEDDYIGLGKRLLILVVDACVIAIALWVADTLWYSLPPSDTTYTLLSWGLPVFAYVYLTVVKASTIRTLGYRLVGAKVLTFQGKRPSVFCMTLRLFLWLAGPLNLVMDLICDKRGQAPSEYYLLAGFAHFAVRSQSPFINSFLEKAATVTLRGIGY